MITLDIKPFELNIPVAQILAEADDPWLKETLQLLTGPSLPGATWEHAVAAGLSVRHGSTKDATRVIKDMLKGGDGPPPSAAVLWMRGASQIERDTIRYFTLAEVDLLHTALDDVLADMLTTGQWVQASIEALMRRREELEGVFVLLHDFGLALALQTLDARARRLLPVLSPVTDELLWRAKIIAADSWWCSTARHP